MTRDAVLERTKEALEEELEYSNVTDLRQGLLRVVERLQKTPALRFLILKHGRPQAVLMSFKTYELLKKVMNQALATRSIGTREEALQAAFERLRAERPEQAAVAYSSTPEVTEGAVLTGTVKNLTEYGAFIDLGGIDGLLHVTDMSWGRVIHPGQLLRVGDHIRVKVLRYDKERQRVSLGVKQLMPEGSAEAEVSKPADSKLAE